MFHGRDAGRRLTPGSDGCRRGPCRACGRSRWQRKRRNRLTPGSNGLQQWARGGPVTAGPTAPYRIRPSVVRDGLARPCGAENGPVVYARLVLASGAARDGGSKSRCGGKSGTRAVADNMLIIKQRSILHVGKTRQDKSLFRSLSDTYLPPLRCVVLKKVVLPQFS